MTRARRILTAAALAPVLLTGCTDWAGYDLDYLWGYIPALATLRHSVTYDPYEMPRLPAPHAVALGDAPASFAPTQLDSVAATLTSPWAGGTVPPEVLQRGEAIFQTQCSACHGPAGAGTGPVVGPGKFPFAPPVNGAATAARSDGYIYGVIAAGRGLMPPYGEKVAHMDRWAVVAYVRELERAGGAAPASVPAAAPATGAATTGAAAAPAGDTAAAVAP